MAGIGPHIQCLYVGVKKMDYLKETLPAVQVQNHLKLLKRSVGLHLKGKPHSP